MKRQRLSVLYAQRAEDLSGGRGISRGDYAGLPPKGEETLVGIRIHRKLEGKITEEWSTLDVRPVWEDLAQEIRKRERVEQDLRVARRIQ